MNMCKCSTYIYIYDLQAVDQKHLESSEMWCWRRMKEISWTDHVRNEEVLLRVKEQRNILHEIRKRKANWIGHILRRNCLLQRVIEGKIQGGIKVTGRQGRRHRKLLDDLKERRGYSHLKEDALDRTMWRARFGRGFGPVVRQTTKWMNEPTRWDHVLEFIIPMFLIAQHVSSDTSLIVRSSKTVFAASGLHTSVVAGRWQRPATTDVCKLEAANTVFELLTMSDVSLETCWAIRNTGIINSNTWSHLVCYF